MKRRTLQNHISHLSIAILLLFASALGLSKTWIGTTHNLWSWDSNWSPTGVPGPGDSLSFIGTHKCTLDVNTEIKNWVFNTYGGEITIIGPDTIKISGDMNFNGFFGTINSNPAAAIAFIGNGAQNFICPTTATTLPGIIHSGAGVLNQTGPLKCFSFLQTAGTYNINGQHDTTTMGNFIVSNSVAAASSFLNLDNTSIVVQYGDVVLSGHANDSINLNPANTWNLSALNGHGIKADFAKIHFCAANGPPTTAANSIDLGSNAGWLFINPNNKIWNNASLDGKWSTPQNWAPFGAPAPTDTVRFIDVAGPCRLDVNATIRTIKFESSAYIGPFDFMNDTLLLTDSADFTGPTSATYIAPGNGAIGFIGSGTHSFYAKHNLQLPGIIQNGGITNVKSNGFSAKNLSIKSGTFFCGSGFIDSVAGTLTLQPGALLQLGSSNLLALEVNTFGGNLDFQNGQMTIYGSSNTNFAFDNVLPGNGARLNLQQINWHFFAPPLTGILPPIFKSGPDSVIVQGSLKAQGLHLSGGAWNWGLDGRTSTQAFSHYIDSITTTGNARMLFSSGPAYDTVKVKGNANLSGLNPISGMFAGAGELVLNGAGNQLLTPMPAMLHPSIIHNGSGTLIVSNNLLCFSFSQTNGSLDFGNKNITSINDFLIVNNPGSAILNLNGSIIQAASASFQGFPNDTLLLTPSAAWSVNVIGNGALFAYYVKIGNCNASGSTGYANNSPFNASNTNWKFGKFWIAHFSDSLWTSPYNWGPYGVPTPSDSVVFDNSSIFGCILNSSETVRTIAITPSFSHVFNFNTSTLNISGDADFSGGIYNPGTGNLSFIGTGTQNFQPAFGQILPNIIHTAAGTISQNNHLKCLSLLQSNGKYSFNGNKQDTITTGNFTISNGTSQSVSGLAYCSIVIQNGNADFSGIGGADSFSLRAPSPWFVNVMNGTLAATNAILQNCNASGSVSTGTAAYCRDAGANVNWIFSSVKFWTNSSGDYLWSTPNNWSPPGIPTMSDSVIFDNHASNSNCLFNSIALVKAIILTSAYTASFDFSQNDTLKVVQTLDFQNYRGAITAGNGVIALNGVTSQFLYPPNPATSGLMPKIIQNNPAVVTVQKNRFRTSSLVLNSGVMTIDTALTIDSIYIGLSSLLKLSNTLVHCDTATAIWGMGSLDMGWANLAISGDLNFANLSSFIPGISKIAFIGPATKTFSPKAGVLFSNLEQVNGATLCATNGFSINALTLTGGTFNLGYGFSDTILSQIHGVTGILDLGSSVLNIQAAMADFTTININAGLGALAFIGPNPQTFAPRFGVVYPNIIQNGYSGTNVIVNPLKAKSLTCISGTIKFAEPAIFRDSVGSISIGTGGNRGLDLGNDTLDVEGNVDLSDFTTIPAASGVLRFVGIANQNFNPPAGITGPNIIHSGSGLINQTNRLKCASFFQTNGAYNLNFYSDTIADGDFTITNGTPISIQGLGNNALVVQNGNATFSGQNFNNMLNLGSAAPWKITVPSSKTISAQYALVGNCKAISQQLAQPLYCALSTTDSNWNNSAVTPRIFDTLGVMNNLFACQRSDGSDTIDIWYQLSDFDNSVDTVTLSFKNGKAASLSSPGIGAAKGDVGIVASSDSSFHRHIRLSAAQIFGGSFATDSLQFALSALDNFGNATMVLSSSIKISTKAPMFGADIFILPSSGSSLAGGVACSITWNYNNISFYAQSRKYPLTLQYSIDNGNNFIIGAENLQNSGAYSWITPVITKRNIVLRFVAIDTFGNTGYSSVSAPFTLDATPPVSTITFPPNKSYINGLKGINGAAGDSCSGVKSLSIAIRNVPSGNYWNGMAWIGSATWLPTIVTSSNTWTFSGPLPPISNGSTIIIMSQAIDSANISQINYAIDTLFVDTVPPVSTITYPVNNSALSSLSSIIGSVNDLGAGVSSLVISLKNETDTLYWAEGNGWIKSQTWLMPSGQPSGYSSWAYSPPVLTTGKKYTVRSKAFDWANNSEIPSAGATFLFSTSAPGSPSIAINNKQKFISISPYSLTLSAQNADSMQFKTNSGTWSPWEPYASIKNNLSFVTQGSNKIFVVFKDRAGNMTAPISDSAVYDSKAPLCFVQTHGVFSPATWPGYVLGSSFDSLSGVKSVGISVKCAATGLFWNGAAWSGDSSLPFASLVNEAWKMNIGANVLQSSQYVLKAIAFDSAGNSSVTAIDSINFSPKVANTLIATAMNIGDSALAITWKVDLTIPFMKNVLFGFNYGTIPESSIIKSFRYADSSFVLGALIKTGVWYFVAGLADSAGNISPLRIDSVNIANTPPLFTATKDTAIPENHQWQGNLAAIDRNGDTVHYRIVNQPIGFIIDSISGAMSWTPEYSNVGKNTLIAVAQDNHGGMAMDTFTVTVRIVPPKIVYTGDTIAHEDSLFFTHIQITNVSKGDSIFYTKKNLPSWMKLSNDTLSGVPGAADLGNDTIQLAISEKGGICDTLKKTIIVLHTNHSPKIKVWSKPGSILQYSSIKWSFSASDIDKGDSLSLTWHIRPAWLMQISNAIQGAERIFTIGGTPQSSDVNWTRFSFSVHDTAGSSFTIQDSLFIVPMPTTIIHKDKRQLFYGAIKYIVSGNDYLDTALTFLASLRSLDDSSITSVKKSPTGTITFFPLVDGRYEFKVQAIDRRGLMDPNAPKDTFIVSGASRRIFADTSWTMMSIPSIPFSATSIAGKGHLLHWDESGGEENIYRYYRGETDFVQTNPGLSFWRRSPDTLSINLKNQDIHDTIVSIKLNKGAYGWNQISSPFTYAAKWPGGGAVWNWNDSTHDYDEADSVLLPWEGYWVMSDSAMLVRLENSPVFSNAAVGKRKIVYFENKGEWRVRILLKSNSGSDRNTVLGFSKTARDGFDRNDKPKPPMHSNSRYAYFWHPEWKKTITEFASDIRQQIAPINVFQIGIAPAEDKKNNARISFNGINNLSSIFCFLADQNSITPIEEAKEYALEFSSNIVYKTIFVATDKNFLKNYPLHFTMATPYPNPCRPMATIKYVLPYRFDKNGLLNMQPFTVKLELYDIMGRKIRQLVDHSQSPGMYRVLWDGKNASGRIAASGSYFCKLEACEYSAIKKILMMK